MNLSAPFIRRPIMTTLLMASLLIFGLMSYRRLAVSDLPNVDFPTIMVSAALPGASPETMASAVATPLERQFSTIEGLDSMSSTSSLGSTQVVLQFDLERELDAAALDVQAAISRANADLPSEMPAPPSYQKVNPALQPIIYIALTSPTLPLYELNEYGDTMMAQRISTVSGVAQVMIYGSQKYAVRIQVNPMALAARSIGLDQVIQAVRSGNTNLPTGVLDGPDKALTIETNGQLTTAQAYEPLILRFTEGNPVRLQDVGRAIDSVENDKTAAWYIDQRSIILAVQRQPGANTVEVATAVRELLPSFQALLPASVSLHVLYDRSDSIRESVDDVQLTLILAFALVVLVIFLFLRNLRATIIPSLAIPLSLVGTFSVMYLLDFSINNLSLMALILSVGFVVDDAIVMLENIFRHLEMGEGVVDGSLKGSQEIGFTIISMTLSLAAVFIPVLFLGGILGRLFNEFAVTIAVAVLISGAISLTLTPMLCSRFLKPPSEIRHGRLFRASERFFDVSSRLYGRTLAWALNYRLIIMAVSLALLVASAYLFGLVPKGFIPSEDTSMIFGFTEAQEGISFESMVEHQRAVAAVVAQEPSVEAFMSSVGARGGITGSNTGVLFIRLKPREGRPPVDEVIQALQPKVAEVPGIRVYLQNLPTISVGGRLTKSQYQYTLQSSDTEALYRYAPVLEARLRELKVLQDVTSDLQITNPQVTMVIDRDKAAFHGLTAQQVEEALYSAYGSREISTIYAPDNLYRVILEVLPFYQREVDVMSLLHIRSSQGELVPLKALGRLESGVGALSISHTGQLPSVTLSFNLPPDVSLGEALGEVERASRQALPEAISTNFQGTAEAFQASLQGLGLLLLMAVVVIYIVLGILYESFIHPLTILSALPFAGFGALLTLLLFGDELSIYAFVGLIMLVGLVMKNGIMVIDFAIEGRSEGKEPRQAIYDASLVRFRPILMTTLSTILGALPIALGLGAGGEARRPLGLAVVGGLAFSQLLTLYATPVLYTYMEALQGRLRRRGP